MPPAHTKKFELLKVSRRCAVSSSRKMSLSTRMMPPSARPVREAAMPSPTYRELCIMHVKSSCG
jgi:hypothetical protein